MSGGVLERIVAFKKREVSWQKERISPSLMKELAAAAPASEGFKKALECQTGPAIIAEVKRASPSTGVLRPDLEVPDWSGEDLASASGAGGARALSVLTDNRYFWGQKEMIAWCKQAAGLPALRKDFIVDAYQVDESRWLGADAILLLARTLEIDVLRACAERAIELGMDVLVEVHEDLEVQKALKLPEEVLIGVNHRDLSSLRVDHDRAAKIYSDLPEGRFLVAESGISDSTAIKKLYEQGYQAFLVGTHLARSPDPTRALKMLLGQ
ncbi:MAG: indole-3-glycerol phosphate synthase TrpC [Myxococcota bacterium]|nr:indole-3-glycerol phosphate synthase TrpC [Myxococcota bacterium]